MAEGAALAVPDAVCEPPWLEVPAASAPAEALLPDEDDLFDTVKLSRQLT